MKNKLNRLYVSYPYPRDKLESYLIPFFYKKNYPFFTKKNPFFELNGTKFVSISSLDFEFRFRFRFRLSISSFGFEFRFRVSVSSFDFKFRFRVLISSLSVLAYPNLSASKFCLSMSYPYTG